MPNLQVKGIEKDLYEELKSVARRDNRSVTQEVIYILGKYLANPKAFDQNPTREFLSLSGSFDDDRSAEEIIAAIRKGRRKSGRFTGTHGLLD